MPMVSRHGELAGFAHNPDTQVSVSTTANFFLEKIKESPIRRLDAKPMRKTVRAAVKELNRLQHEYREMYAVHLMPYYEALVDALANHACEMLAFIERSETGAEPKA
jgi:hypothetical protein